MTHFGQERASGTSIDRIFWCLLVPLAAFALLGALAIAPFFIPVGSRSIDPDAVLKCRLAGCQPEPDEQLRYLLAIIVVPVVFWLGLRGANAALAHRQLGWLEGSIGSWWENLVRLCVMLFVIAMFMVQMNVPSYWIYVGLLTAPVGVWALCRWWEHWPEARKEQFRQVIRRAGDKWSGLPVEIAFVFVGLEVLPAVLVEGQPIEPGSLFHFSYVLNEFAAVLNGKTLRVDFFPQYQGLMAHLLAPWFRVTGLTVTTFTATMAMLSALGFLSVYSIFTLLTRSLWKALLLFLPFLWVSCVPSIWYPEFWYERVNAVTYFGISPIRMLGPWITAVLLARYLQAPSAIRLVSLSFAATLAAINNLDFGVPALAGAVAAVLLTRGARQVPRERTIIRFLFELAVGASLAIIGYLALLVGVSGEWPEISSVTLFQRAFVTYGFYMLPMPTFGMHWVYYLTFMAAIAQALMARPAEPLARGLLLFSGIFGCGAMTYYVGRSHPSNLLVIASTWAFAFLQLVWSHWHEVAPEDTSRRRLPSVNAWLLGAGYVLCCSAIITVPNIFYEIARRTAPPDGPWPARDALVDFIRAHADRNEPVAIVYRFGFLLAEQAKVRNVFPFADEGSIILRSQLALVVRELDRTAVRHVFGRLNEDLGQELQDCGYSPTDRFGDFILWERANTNAIAAKK